LGGWVFFPVAWVFIFGGLSGDAVAGGGAWRGRQRRAMPIGTGAAHGGARAAPRASGGDGGGKEGRF